MNLKLKPNERERVRANCTKKGCPWHILGSIEGSTGNFRVITYYPVHKCYKKTRNKMCNPPWIAKNFKDRIISEPQIKLHQIQALIRKAYGLYVSKTSRIRAKMIVMKENMGDYKKEFARLHDYAEMLKSTNPGTIVVIRTSKNAEPGKVVFIGIYVCLEALKTGWLEGFRNIIGFNGTFLKETCKGELFSCISKCLKHDLNLTETEGEGLTDMSDMQKGLHLAITQLLPNIEMRWCARHIWTNWKQTWLDEERRKHFWQCARATFEVYFSWMKWTSWGDILFKTY
ncbi:uncharacterized protein [Nicotiana tomentosiformis]|uniref:uncharacterized protein n=1 Tax=Nicotiana tomentosiformis TaxID=4098 RepID=UPI00388C8C5C